MGDGNSYFQVAKDLVLRGEPEQALKSYDEARSLSPSDPRILDMAELCIKEKWFPTALVVITDFVQEYGGDLESLDSEDDASIRLKELSNALSIYERAYYLITSIDDEVLNPSIGLALWWLTIYVQEADWRGETNGQFTHLFDRVFKDAGLRGFDRKRYFTYLCSENEEDLLRLGEKGNVEAYYYLGDLVGASDKVLAQEAFELVSWEDPFYTGARIELSQLAYKVGNLEETEEYVEDALRRSPKSFIAKMLLKAIQEERTSLLDAQIDEQLNESTVLPRQLESDPEGLSRYIAEHFQLNKQNQEKSFKSMASRLEKLENTITSQMEASNTQIRGEISHPNASQEQISAILKKECDFWNHLEAKSQEFLINAERDLNLPFCVDLEGFSGSVLDIHGALVIELELAIYQPVIAKAKLLGRDVTGFEDVFRRREGGIGFSLGAFSSAIARPEFDSLSIVNFNDKPSRQVSKKLRNLNGTRNRAAHTGEISLKEARVFRQGAFEILELFIEAKAGE
jgi:tetratricopeptide (TPR) repeat protein